MKTRNQKALLAVFLAITVGLAALLCYTAYMWTGVGALLSSLDQNTTIDNVELLVQNSTSTSMSVTMTIHNSFAGSALTLHIALKELRVYPLAWSLEDVFADTTVPPLSNSTVRMSFNVPVGSSDSISFQNLTLTIRMLAKTAVNPDIPISLLPFPKTYTANP